MRLTVLTICIFTLVFSCFAEIGHSHAAEYSDGHVHVNVVDQNDQTSDTEQTIKGQNQCSDCCTHSHAVLLLFQAKPSAPNMKQVLSWCSDSHYSINLSRLNRPPKA